MRAIIPLLPQYVFMAWCLVKHKDTLSFSFSFLKKIIIEFKQDGGWLLVAQ